MVGICAPIPLSPRSWRNVTGILLWGCRGVAVPLGFVVVSTLTLVIIFGDFNIHVDDPSLIMAFHFLDPFSDLSLYAPQLPTCLVTY